VQLEDRDTDKSVKQELVQVRKEKQHASKLLSDQKAKADRLERQLAAALRSGGRDSSLSSHDSRDSRDSRESRSSRR
jgi:hypothetical protein